MATSVGMKLGKKQSPERNSGNGLEQSLLALENICFNIMESRFTQGRDDLDGLYWQRRFKNIVTPVSLALRERNGPRHFHNHYRHRKDDDSVLQPVLEDPIEMIAHACQTGLKACQAELVGIPSVTIRKKARLLEAALRSFLQRYESTRAAS